MILEGRIPVDLPDQALEPGGELAIDGMPGLVGTIRRIEVVDGFLVIEAVFHEILG